MRVFPGRTSLKQMQSVGGLLSSLEKETFRRANGQRERFLYDGDESAYGQIAITELSRQRDTPAK